MLVQGPDIGRTFKLINMTNQATRGKTFDYGPLDEALPKAAEVRQSLSRHMKMTQLSSEMNGELINIYA